MRGGYQIVDLSNVTVGTETKVDGVYKIISGFDGKPVFIITPNTSGVFAEFTENSGMYIGAYIGSNSHLFTVSIISSDRVTITDKGPAGGGGTSNYNELSNKPAIAGTTLSGDKSLADLGIQGALTAGTNISISESNEISANVSSMAAANVTFDNTGTGMSADDVQEALAELNSKTTDRLIASAPANQAHSAQIEYLETYFNALTDDERKHSYLVNSTNLWYCTDFSQGTFGRIEGAGTSVAYSVIRFNLHQFGYVYINSDCSVHFTNYTSQVNTNNLKLYVRG